MLEADATPDLPRGHWRVLLALLRRAPQAGLSRALGRLADLRLPRPLRRLVLGSFARAVGVRLSEVEKPLAEYPTLNAFFVRRLRPEMRVWPADPTTAGSPVDGIVGSIGTIRDGAAVQAKGRSYTVAALLGDPAGAEIYEGGRFVTLYLSPRHYHRVHAPGRRQDRRRPPRARPSTARQRPVGRLRAGSLRAQRARALPDRFPPRSRRPGRGRRLQRGAYLDRVRSSLVGSERVGEQPPRPAATGAHLRSPARGRAGGRANGLPPRLDRDTSLATGV